MVSNANPDAVNLGVIIEFGIYEISNQFNYCNIILLRNEY